MLSGAAPSGDGGRRMRTAVVGVGRLGRLHAKFLAELPSSQLVGVHDLSAETAAAVARETRSAAFGSLEELIAARPEFVVVATPTESHVAIARPLLASGIPTLVEKPLTKTIEEADELLALARENVPAAFLGVGHVERFNPVVQAARTHVHDPLFIECDRVHPFSFRSMDIGVVLDLMIHDIDLVLWLAASKLEGIEGVGASVLTPFEDMAYARLAFENGCVALVRASRVSLRKTRKLRVFCPDLYVSLDYLTRQGSTIRVKPGARDEVLRLMGEGREDPAMFLRFLDIVNLVVEEEQPLKAELSSFLEALAAGAPPPVTGQNGRDALACALSIQAEIVQNLDAIRKKRQRAASGGQAAPAPPPARP